MQVFVINRHSSYWPMVQTTMAIDTYSLPRDPRYTCMRVFYKPSRGLTIKTYVRGAIYKCELHVRHFSFVLPLLGLV